jgi:hypothetical protein
MASLRTVWQLGSSLLLLVQSVRAQVAPSRSLPRVVALDSVAVSPQATASQGWLLLDHDLQTELEGAVQNLYNFQFERAEKQFRSLRRRYPQHPLPYFLLALSTWWRLAPYPPADTRYDPRFYAFLDTAETKAHALLRADQRNYEACFLLAAAYGYEARLASDRHQWRRATVASRRALDYLQQSRAANGLSAEFQLGYCLFDYYAGWISAKYPWLRPVLFFFPKGHRERGLAALRQVSEQAFYARTEATYFRVLILSDPREQQAAAALPLARQLAAAFPGNSVFAVEYARLAFDQGQWLEAETAAQAILIKCGQGLVGYEARSGRTAAYLLAYLRQHRHGDLVGAADLYRRCLVFAETAQLTQGGYYVFAAAALAELATRQADVSAARRYYMLVLDHAPRRTPEAERARAYLRHHPAP